MLLFLVTCSKVCLEQKEKEDFLEILDLRVDLETKVSKVLWDPKDLKEIKVTQGHLVELDLLA